MRLHGMDAVLAVLSAAIILTLISMIAPNNIVFQRMAIVDDAQSFLQTTTNQLGSFIEENNVNKSTGNILLDIIDAVTSTIANLFSSVTSVLENIPIIGQAVKIVAWLSGAVILIIRIFLGTIALLLAPRDYIDFMIGVSMLPLGLYLIASLIGLIQDVMDMIANIRKAITG